MKTYDGEFNVFMLNTGTGKYGCDACIYLISNAYIFVAFRWDWYFILRQFKFSARKNNIQITCSDLITTYI